MALCAAEEQVWSQARLVLDATSSGASISGQSGISPDVVVGQELEIGPVEPLNQSLPLSTTTFELHRRSKCPKLNDAPIFPSDRRPAKKPVTRRGE